jgi:hypothetical protein
VSEDYQPGKFEDGFVLPAETASVDGYGLICYVPTGDTELRLRVGYEGTVNRWIRVSNLRRCHDGMLED